MVAWCLWFNRNEVKLGKARLQGLAILQKARYMPDEFQTANLKLSQTSPKEEVRLKPQVICDTKLIATLQSLKAPILSE